MTLLIYPISGSWVWNAGGWLAKMGFTDFAGSSVVHSVGWASLVAAALVGPRIGSIILTGQMQYLDTI
jgi:Amt family ammonium transporter